MQDAEILRSRVCRIAATLVASFLTAMIPAEAQAQTVTASWDASPLFELVTGYQVCIGTAALTCNVRLASVSALTTRYTFSPTPGTMTFVATRAVNLLGVSPYSNEVRFSIPAFTQPANQTSRVGVAISPVNLSVSDPDGGPRSFTHLGLPVGLTLNGTTGQITGTPVASGTFSVTLFVNDGIVSVSRSLTWTVTSSSSDTLSPTLTVSSPTPGQTFSTSSITVSGTATDSGRGSSGITGVRVNGVGASGGTATGSNTANWSRSITLASGSNTITVDTTDGAGNSSMQQFTVSYSASGQAGGTSVPSGVNAVSASPSSGVGSTQLFTFVFSESRGAQYLSKTWAWFKDGVCMVHYDRVLNRLNLLNDASTAWAWASLGSNTSLGNGACSVALGSSSVSVSGSVLTLKLAMSFTSSAVGTKAIQMYADTTDGRSTGWQERGTWTIPTSSTQPAGVSAVSVSPNSGSGSSQTFSLVYSDSRGAQYLSATWVWFNASFTSSSANSCLLYYDRATGRINLLSDDGNTWRPAVLGTSGVLQNSRCTLSLPGSWVSLQGTTLTLNLAMSFSSIYRGTKNTYMYAASSDQSSSGWQTRGTWVVP